MRNELSRKIVEYRAAHNISQAEFARRCRLSPASIQAIELGKSNITQLTEAKILYVISGKNRKDV